MPGADFVNPETAYKGVKGWLLVFCGTLATGLPVHEVLVFFDATEIHLPQLSEHPVLWVAVVGGVLRIIRILFSVYAGVSLWAVRPGAVTTAKRFLVFDLVYGVLPFVVALAPIAACLPGRPTFVAGAEDLAAPILFFVVWYSYLLTSMRARVTYSTR